MESKEMSYLIVIFVLLSFLFTVYILFRHAKNEKSQLETIDLSQLTVVVPFRNEEQNIQKLLDSIAFQKEVPKEIIFVNDHSDDKSCAIIESFSKKWSGDLKLLHLGNDELGKAKAVLKGVEAASTLFCLSLDADVYFQQNDFFKTLPELAQYSMLVLPVEMKGEGLFGNLLELEYGSFSILQKAVPNEKPLMVSGANMLFKRKAYLTCLDSIRNSFISSGDDLFLLSCFKKKNYLIRSFTSPSFAVQTAVPDDFISLIRQRMRWMRNNRWNKDWRSVFFLSWIFSINILFLIILVVSALQNSFLVFLVVFCFKLVLDAVLYRSYLKQYNKIYLLYYFPLLVLLYPFYLLNLLLSFTFSRNNDWKGRRL
jgi:poly-beta-1,6-N-acetyl-D-glucosamine synthase